MAVVVGLSVFVRSRWASRDPPYRPSPPEAQPIPVFVVNHVARLAYVSCLASYHVPTSLLRIAAVLPCPPDAMPYHRSPLAARRYALCAYFMAHASFAFFFFSLYSCPLCVQTCWLRVLDWNSWSRPPVLRNCLCPCYSPVWIT